MKEIFEGIRDLILGEIPYPQVRVYRKGQNIKAATRPIAVIDFDGDGVDGFNSSGGYDYFNIWIYAKPFDLDTVDDLLPKVIKSLDKKSIITHNGDDIPVLLDKGSTLFGETEIEKEPFYRVGFSIPKLF